MLDPETRKALQFICYKTGRCLREDQFTPEDFNQILIAGISPLVRKSNPLVTKLLKWLGQFCTMSEVLEGARQVAGQKAVWGLKLFARVVRGL